MGDKRHVKRGLLKSRRSRLLCAILTFIAVLAIVIPPAVVVTLRKKANDMGPKSSVFVPLYVYPAPDAWTPLQKVITAYPDVNFTVVVNPGSGPGPEALPDGNYTREIPKLTAHPNTRVLGYVATTYATRDKALVVKDVETYANWPEESSNPKLALNGIFFDETPQEFNASAFEYLKDITGSVKGMANLGPENFVVNNPGAVPDPRYLETADSTVVFEETYDTFKKRVKANVLRDIPNSDRGQLCCVIHSVPSSVTDRSLRNLVKDARKVADEVFVTHLSEDYYAGFGKGWKDFVELMAK